MKIQCFFVVLTTLIFFQCSKVKNAKLFPGLWKIDRIELHVNDKLQKTINEDHEYWKFYQADSIVIFEKRQMQNCLQIKIGPHSIESIDRERRRDELFIDTVSNEKLQLSSKQKSNDLEYTIVYYLERVKDGEEEVIGD